MKFDPAFHAELDTLRARLRALEMRIGNTEREALPSTDFPVLLTECHGARLAFQLDQIHSVVPAAELGPLPEAPEWLLGVLTLRGRSIPTVDVATRLGATGRRLEASDLIVVTQGRGRELGFVVQSVEGVVNVVRSSIESTVHETPHASYVLGTFTAQGRSVLIVGVTPLIRQVAELGSEESSEALA